MTEPRRPAKPIALVVSDVDGTLVNRAKVLTPRVRAALDALKARGVGFSVASARPPLGLRPIVEKLGLDNPVGAVNGGAIVRPDLSVISELLLPEEAVRVSVDIMRREGLDPWLFTRDKWYLRDPDGAHVDHEARTLAMDGTVVADFDEVDFGRTLKIVGASHDHPRLAEVEDILQAELGGRALATRSQAYYLDVTNADANKGAAVRGIAKAMGVPLDRVLTIGDGDNDTPMFDVGGFSVAMGNASPAVQALAAAVTDSCEADGFAVAIERYVLDVERALVEAAP